MTTSARTAEGLWTRHSGTRRKCGNFEETKQQAMNELAANSGGGTAVGIRLFIIAALVVLLFWMFINLDGYNMNQKREKKAANKNYEAYVEQIEQYLADRDYTQLSVFVDKHELDMNDKYRQV